MSISFPREEEVVLERWNEINAFHRQLELTKDKPTYTFYDGPPFATGSPHYGHLLASTIKDIIPRYWSMKGRHVERRFGWDTHGVPIEQLIDNQLQQELGVRGAEAVAKIGIAEYNRRCREIVLGYAGEWRTTIGRLGRWIDFDNDYKTMDPTFMESCWWVFKQLFEKDMVYHGAKVLPYSLGLATPLSKSEASEDRRDVHDPAIVVSFPLLDEPECSFLAWTTTPWTIPTNIALCANPKFEYLKIRDGDTNSVYILLEAGLRFLYKDPKKAAYAVLEKIKGTDLLGVKYRPPFDYYYEEFKDFGFKILNDEYVEGDEGVGIVHQSPAYGDDDQRVCLAAGVISDKRPAPDPMDATGHYSAQIADFQGQQIRDAEKAIVKHLESVGRLVRKSQVKHNIAHCPRSKTPLIQRAVPSWFIRVQPMIPRLLKNLESTHWVPDAVKNRFRDWLSNARDWNVSRNRFWGTPIPLWASDDLKEVICIGSVDELKRLSGHTGEIKDLHRDTVDDITIPSKQGKGVLRRVPQVFDCWFESGSMPYASCHFPFQDPDRYNDGHFGDFIAEGLDQTRGWFYSLSVLCTALYDTFPYKNCVVNGMLLAADGKKMSKSLKNYPDPRLVMDKYGSDALRLYMINSPVVRGESLNFKEDGVKQIVSAVMLPLWNSYNFFDQQINQMRKDTGDEFSWDPKMEASNTNVMDRWILASCQELLVFINKEMDQYRLSTVVPRLLELIESTTNWYIRFNRDRLRGKGEQGEKDRLHSLNTLFEVLFTLVRALAPFTPFITDTIYKRIQVYIPTSHHSQDMRSVHFLPFPEVRTELEDADVRRRVGRMQHVIEQGRIARERRTISLKNPLKSIVVVSTNDEFRSDVESLKSYILSELNIQDLILSADEAKYNVQYTLAAEFKTLGIKFRKDASKITKALPKLSADQVKDFRATGKITVEGHDLDRSDLRVLRSIAATAEQPHIEIALHDEFVLILDTFAYPELAQEGLARECLNRLQRLRKEVSLVPTDDVKILYRVVEGDEKEVDDMFREQKAMLQNAASVIEKQAGDAANATDERLIASESISFKDVVLALELLKL